MDYFPKTEMSQLMPATSSTTSVNYTPDLYSAYADSFDLSLLSTTDDRETVSLSSSSATSTTLPEHINKCQSISSSSTSSSSSTTDALDYIPTTIFNNDDQSMTLHCNNKNNSNNNNNHNNTTLSPSDQLIPVIKTEKLWNCDSTISLNNNNKNSTILENNNFNLNSSNYNNTQQIIGQVEDCSTTTASLLFQQLQKQYQFYPSPLPSPPQYEFCNLNSVSSSNNYSLYSPASSTLSPSPCPSLDQQIANSFGSINYLNNINNQNNNTYIQVKQEYLILPPSPPESNGSPSPSLNEIKSEPGDNEIETNFIDINILLEKTLRNFEENQKKLQQQQQSENKQQNLQQQLNSSSVQSPPPVQDHQLLREYLQDTTFQKKHNLKPLALESLIGGLGVRGDIEPVISLALEHAKRDAQATCVQLQISPDPQQWTTTQVHAWIQSTIEQFKLQQINELESKFPENGANLLCLSEDEFIRRVPESGATIHAQLEIWKLACCDNFPINMFPAGPSTSTTNNNSSWPTNDCDMDFTDDEDVDMEPQSSITTLDPINNISIENGQQTTSTNTTPSQTTTTTTTNVSTNLNITTIGALLSTPPPHIITTGASSSSSVTSTSISTATSITNNTQTTTTTSTAVATTTTTTTKSPRTGGSHIHLWQFLKELLASPQVHGTAIRWLDRNKGVFKIEDSVKVAKLWGRRKNRPAMNYDKLSRSIRQYYKKGIMKKTERSQRLVYQFCHPYCL